MRLHAAGSLHQLQPHRSCLPGGVWGVGWSLGCGRTPAGSCAGGPGQFERPCGCGAVVFRGRPRGRSARCPGGAAGGVLGGPHGLGGERHRTVGAASAGLPQSPQRLGPHSIAGSSTAVPGVGGGGGQLGAPPQPGGGGAVRVPPRPGRPGGAPARHLRPGLGRRVHDVGGAGGCGGSHCRPGPPGSSRAASAGGDGGGDVAVGAPMRG
mmetsp:Transcript_10964/g.32871  ORF Transcript_10964/g.32871 Transcript_10964/m.32871 type:complete len:209 (+) Transcript_10964:389-1015(+)